MSVRVGILGHGYMGKIREAVVRARDDCQLARIFDGKDDGWKEVAEAPELDVIFVCLPNHLVCEAVCRALEAGKHVLAEKPPGVSAAEVRRMMAAEAATGKTLKFGFNHRYHPAVLAAKSRIESGALGTLVWARGRYGKPFAPGIEKGWRARRDQAGGGILLDQGIHMLDLIRDLCGPIREVRALASTSFSAEVEDDVMVILRSEAGQIASLHSSHTQWQPLFSLELGLTGGAIAIEGLLSKSGRYGPERLRWRTRDASGEHVETFTRDDSWELEVRELLECARTGAPIKVGSSAEALALMTLLDSIYEATRGVTP